MLAAILPAALLALPAAAADAKSTTVKLKGTVVGSPYVAGKTKSDVPVLISKQSAKRARLASPVGVLILPRRRLVRTPQGRVLPGRRAAPSSSAFALAASVSSANTGAFGAFTARVRRPQQSLCRLRR